MIALSIVFVAAEIVHARRGVKGITARAPWVVAFVFGLLHGFGFAGALSEVGLPQGQIPVALLFFNLGVEAGQVLFIGAVLVAIALVRRSRIAVPSGAVAESRSVSSMSGLGRQAVAAFGNREGRLWVDFCHLRIGGIGRLDYISELPLPLPLPRFVFGFGVEGGRGLCPLRPPTSRLRHSQTWLVQHPEAIDQYGTYPDSPGVACLHNAHYAHIR